MKEAHNITALDKSVGLVFGLCRASDLLFECKGRDIKGVIQLSRKAVPLPKPEEVGGGDRPRARKKQSAAAAATEGGDDWS